MDQYKVDFHVHTYYSDGQASPASIVKQAKELEYDMIAVTDHDGVEGVREALIAGEAAELKVVPGIELATETALPTGLAWDATPRSTDGLAQADSLFRDGQPASAAGTFFGGEATDKKIGLHILGYYIDIDHPALKAKLTELAEARKRRNEKLLQVLRELGCDIRLSDLQGKQAGGFIGKPVIARALAEKGYVANPGEAFQPGRFLGSPQALAVKKEKLGTAQAIALIKEAGGIPVLAHPIQTKGLGTPGSGEFYENMDRLIGSLKKQGLKGLECFHPDQDRDQTLRFIQLAEKYHLHITKGSDFHGKDFSEAPPVVEM